MGRIWEFGAGSWERQRDPKTGGKNPGSSGKSQRKGIFPGIFAEDPGSFWECRRNLGGIFGAGFRNAGVLTGNSGSAAQPGSPFMAPPPLPPHLSQVATPTPATPPGFGGCSRSLATPPLGPAHVWARLSAVMRQCGHAHSVEATPTRGKRDNWEKRVPELLGKLGWS